MLRNDGWTAEAAIPFSVFTKEGPARMLERAPKAGDRWRINVAREKRTLELSCIRYMKDAGFTNAELFPVLEFLPAGGAKEKTLPVIVPKISIKPQDKPVFSCTFESAEEVTTHGGEITAGARFMAGVNGNGLDLVRGLVCRFPVQRCLPPTEGTLSVWVRPHWKLQDLAVKRVRLFCVLNRIQKKIPLHQYNYFCLLGHSYGQPEAGKPHQLYLLARRDLNHEAKLLVGGNASWPAGAWRHVAVSWRINTGQANGIFRLYLDGRLIARRTDFRISRIAFGRWLEISPDAVVDELKLWNRLLSKNEILAEYARYPANDGKYSPSQIDARKEKESDTLR